MNAHVDSKPTLTERLRDHFFGEDVHPYAALEREIERYLRPEHTLLEAGCGRHAVVLRRYLGRARTLIGVDLVDFRTEVSDPAVHLVNADVGDTGLPSESVDLMISRALMEHIESPGAVFTEVHRLLKPGGHYIYLAPNLGDYAAVLSMMIPNRLHPWLVKLTEGRATEDTFPAYYRCNTRRSITRLAEQSGLVLRSFRYLGQYPAYFMFNPVPFLVATAYEKLISRFDALGFLRGWLMVSLQKPL